MGLQEEVFFVSLLPHCCLALVLGDRYGMQDSQPPLGVPRRRAPALSSAAPGAAAKERGENRTVDLLWSPSAGRSTAEPSNVVPAAATALQPALSSPCRRSCAANWSSAGKSGRSGRSRFGKRRSSAGRDNGGRKSRGAQTRYQRRRQLGRVLRPHRYTQSPIWADCSCKGRPVARAFMCHAHAC